VPLVAVPALSWCGEVSLGVNISLLCKQVCVCVYVRLCVCICICIGIGIGI